MLLNSKKPIHFAKLLVGPSIALAILAYFSYHLVNGDRGLKSYLSLKKETMERDKIVDSLSVEKEGIKKQVEGLGKEPLDMDLLEERIRVMLGLGKKKEITVIYSEEGK